MSKLRIAQGFSLPLDVLTEAVGIVALRGAGKTYTSVVLIEEAYAAGVPSVVIDATGVYHGLRTAADGVRDGLPFYVFGGPHGDLPLEPQAGKLIADVVVDSGHSFVLDLSDFSKAKARQFVAEFLERLYERKARNRTPLLLVVDEADEWAPQKPRGEAARCLGAVEQVAKRGRSRGIGIVLITQRTQAINKDVLDLIETLFAMRISAPRSRQTVQEWLAVKEATDELGVIDSLSSLPTGTAWVWSPVRGLLEKVAVRRIRTFDSYVTPRPGQERPEPGSRASLDLEALGEQMEATVERAKENDPAELRRRIRVLEQAADLAAVHTQPNAVPQIELLTWARSLFGPLGIKEPREGSVAVYLDLIEQAVVKREPERVEVPVLTAEHTDQLARVLREGKAARDEVSAAASVYDSKAAELLLYLESLTEGRRHLKVPPAEVADRPSGASGRRDAGTSPAKAERPVATSTGSGVDGGSNGTLLNRRAERMVLAVLAQYPDGRSKRQTAILAGYAKSGGGFNGALSKLRTVGYIEGSDPLRITDAGLGAIDGQYEPLPTGRALLDHWLGTMKRRAEREVLQVVYDAYPESLSKAEVAERAGYEVGGGGFNGAVSKLRTLELVEGSGELRAAEALFD